MSKKMELDMSECSHILSYHTNSIEAWNRVVQLLRPFPVIVEYQEAAIAFYYDGKCDANTAHHLEQIIQNIIQLYKGQPALPKPTVSLKKILMVMGNTLVLEHGFDPVGAGGRASLNPLTNFGNWMNDTPEARDFLVEQGLVWEMVKFNERGQAITDELGNPIKPR